jgi:hypothetical protein
MEAQQQWPGEASNSLNSTRNQMTGNMINQGNSQKPSLQDLQ